MKLHKEGNVTVIVTFFVIFGLLAGYLSFIPSPLWTQIIITTVGLIIYFRIVYFFRVPNRNLDQVTNGILSPADGEVVAIEEVYEEEFLKTNCLLVSVFMSPSNVHINWIPNSGLITYYKYHPGKHLIAWHPKSSTLNERTSIGLKMQNDKEILIRQIAGALARRIVCYAEKGKIMQQNEELGFIKFGSRVDLYLPLDTNVNVKLRDKVIGGQTVIAYIN